MSETVIQSLIAAGAGFFGALVGAIAAVLGPWWLRRSDRTSSERAAHLESRRAAIVEYVDAQVSLANHVVEADEETKARAIRANRALAELTSRLLPGERAVDDWLHGLGVYGAISTDTRIRTWGFGFAGRILLSWHRGETTVAELRPFRIVISEGTVSSIFVNDWPTGKEMTMDGAKL
ncbi:hypothetical protein [Homoserinimonas sp. A520]